MPLFRIQSNVKIKDKEALLQRASTKMCEILDKPEAYMLVQFQKVKHLIFNGSTDGFVHAEVKAVNLNESATETLSKQVCEFLSEEFNISTKRIYVEFTNARGAMWGWDGKVF